MIVKCVGCLSTNVEPQSALRSRWRSDADLLNRRRLVQHYRCNDCGSRFEVIIDFRSKLDGKIDPPTPGESNV